MSGGSYEYLYAASDLEDLLPKRSQLARMAERLAELDYADDAADETYDLLLSLRVASRQAEVRIRRLSEVWRAIEWWDSADSSEDAVKEALKTYRGQ